MNKESAGLDSLLPLLHDPICGSLLEHAGRMLAAQLEPLLTGGSLVVLTDAPPRWLDWLVRCSGLLSPPQVTSPPSTLFWRSLRVRSLSSPASNPASPASHPDWLSGALLEAPGPTGLFVLDPAWLVPLEPLHPALLLLESVLQRGTLPLLTAADRTTLERLRLQHPLIAPRLDAFSLSAELGPALDRLLLSWSSVGVSGASHPISPEQQAWGLARALSERLMPSRSQPWRTFALVERLGRAWLPQPDCPDPVNPWLTPDAPQRLRDQLVVRFQLEGGALARVWTRVPLDASRESGPFAQHFSDQPALLEALQRLLSGLRLSLERPEGPLASLLVSGARAIDGEELAEAMSRAWFGSGGASRVLRLEELPPDRQESWLFGDPAATDPGGKQGALLCWLEQAPRGVLALMGLEQACARVRARLELLLRTGQLTDGAGVPHLARGWVILALDESQAARYLPQSLGHPQASEIRRLDDAARVGLRQRLSLEFDGTGTGQRSLLDAFDQVVLIHPPERASLRARADRGLLGALLALRTARDGLEVQVAPDVLDWLSVVGFPPGRTAQELKSRIQREILPVISEALEERRSPGARPGPLRPGPLRLGLRRGRLEATWEPPEGGSAVLPFRRTAARAPTEGRILEARAERLLRSVSRRLEACAEQQREHQILLTDLSNPERWLDPEALRVDLERFTTLELQRLLDARELGPLEVLKANRGRSGSSEVPSPAQVLALEQALEQAEAALIRLEAREDAGVAHRSVWLVLTAVEPTQPVGHWLQELTRMELRWCERLGLQAAVVAFEIIRDELCRVALRVEGEGASRRLEMEEGIHRLFHPHGNGLQARVEVVPLGPRPTTVRTDLGPARREGGLTMGKAPSLLGLEPTLRFRLELKGRRQIMDFLGTDREVLSHLLLDLERHWGLPGELPALARTYGEERGGVQDPRTGTAVAVLKEVLEGQLESFLEGWERRGG